MKLLFDMTESLLDSVVRFSSLPGVLYMPVSSRESSPSSLLQKYSFSGCLWGPWSHENGDF